MQIIFNNNPDIAAEEIYMTIKTAARNGVFNLKHVEAIAELTTELANRLKEEKSCGESEG